MAGLATLESDGINIPVGEGDDLVIHHIDVRLPRDKQGYLSIPDTLVVLHRTGNPILFGAANKLETRITPK